MLCSGTDARSRLFFQKTGAASYFFSSRQPNVNNLQFICIPEVLCSMFFLDDLNFHMFNILLHI